MKILSLFANIGVAEAYLSELGIEVCVANEIDKRRANLYKKIYPKTEMISGDIINPSVYKTVLKSSKKYGVDVVIATPPCQGMSRAAGIPKEGDKRNNLILPVIELITDLKPKYIFIENVKRFLEIKIEQKNKLYLISELLEKVFGREYHIEIELIDTKYYSVPQTRIRAIILMSRRDTEKIWRLPQREKNIITLREAIGELPTLDPYIIDATEKERTAIFPNYYKYKDLANVYSKWHKPPQHIKRQVEVMRHTPSGKTAFENNIHFPKKANGEKVKGYLSTYRRLNWDAPASTVTMDNRKISSQNNVHPGRLIGKNSKGEVIYSDARALSILELMHVMTLPIEWPLPENTPEAFLRSIIGEGIPPIFLKKVFENLLK